MNFLTGVSVFCLCLFCGVMGRGWESSKFPNPRRDTAKCGRHGKVSWVCDPDSILSQRESEILDWIIGRISKDTDCPCSSWQCKRRDEGYRVSIALVKSVQKEKGSDNSDDSRLRAVQSFAYDLEHSRWNYGNCDEDIVIVFSQEDNILFIMTGTTTQIVLKNHLMTELQSYVGHYFAPGGDVSAGLYHLLLQIRKVLLREYVSPVILYGHYEAQRAAANYMTPSIATLFCLTLASLLSKLI